MLGLASDPRSSKERKILLCEKEINDFLGCFQVIPFDNKGQLKEASNIRYCSRVGTVVVHSYYLEPG